MKLSPSQRILYSTCLTSFIGPFMATSINVAIPTMAAEFSILADKLSWLVTIFLLSTAAILLPCGKLSDRLGHRHFYIIGVAALGITTLAAGVSPGILWLMLFRSMQGLALAAIFVSLMPILLQSHAPSERGHIIGLSSAAVYLGQSAGPFFGGILTQYVSWRAVFFLSALIILTSYMLILSIKTEWHGKKEKNFDYTGSLLSCGGITIFLYGLSAFRSYTWAPLFLYSGAALLAAFIWREFHTDHPVLPMGIFSSLTFSMSSLAALIHYSATYAVTFLLSFQLQLLLHLDAATTGIILLVQPIVMAFLSPRTGALSDSHDPRYIASFGMTLTMISLFLFAYMPSLTVTYTMLLLALLGTGAAFFTSPNTSAIMSSAPAHYQGTASSILALMRILGQTVSMAVVTLLLSHYTALIANYETAIAQSIHTAFTILAITCFCGIFASLARGKIRK